MCRHCAKCDFTYSLNSCGKVLLFDSILQFEKLRLQEVRCLDGKTISIPQIQTSALSTIPHKLVQCGPQLSTESHMALQGNG